MPFRLEPNLFRSDDSPVREAIREALANAIMHADYRGDGGIVIERSRSKVLMSNPGSLLISEEQAWEGGISVCRNPSIQRMFQMIGVVEKAGSGMGKIRQGWRSQQWQPPRLTEKSSPERVEMTLPMVSLLPQESLEYLHTLFEDHIAGLSADELQALVIAQSDGDVSNSKLRLISERHPSDVTKMLVGLASRGLLVQQGSKRGSTYILNKELYQGDSSHLGRDSSHLNDDSSHLGKDSSHLNDSSSHLGGGLTQHEGANLHKGDAGELIPQVKIPGKIKTKDMEEVIVNLCRGRFLRADQIAAFVDRDSHYIRQKYLSSMVNRGRLRLKYPDRLTRPDQAYTSADGTSDS
ncbi:MAG: ATP-binding protein [Armatimonadota bacterium]